MEKQVLLYLKNKKNYYDYLKENSYWVKEINRTNSLTNFENYIKDKYNLRTTDRISDAIDNIDLLSSVLSTLR